MSILQSLYLQNKMNCKTSTYLQAAACCVLFLHSLWHVYFVEAVSFLWAHAESKSCCLLKQRWTELRCSPWASSMKLQLKESQEELLQVTMETKQLGGWWAWQWVTGGFACKTHSWINQTKLHYWEKLYLLMSCSDRYIDSFIPNWCLKKWPEAALTFRTL